MVSVSSLHRRVAHPVGTQGWWLTPIAARARHRSRTCRGRYGHGENYGLRQCRLPHHRACGGQEERRRTSRHCLRLEPCARCSLAVSCIFHSVSLCACVRKVVCACVRVCACPSDVRSSEPRRLARRRRRPRGAPSLWRRRARAPAPARRARRSEAVQRTKKTVQKTAAMCCRYAPACSGAYARRRHAPVLCSTRAPPHPIPRPHLSPLSTPRPSRARARRGRTRGRAHPPACACTRLWARGCGARPPRWVGWRGPVWLRGYALGAARRGAARARARRVRCCRFPRARSTAAQRCPDSVGLLSQRPMEGSPIDQSKRSDREQGQSVRSQTTCEKHVGGWGPTRRGGGAGAGEALWCGTRQERPTRAPHSHV